MLMSMLMRMGLPFGLAAVLLETRHWLVDAGVLPMLLVMYLVALIVETLLSLWIVGALRVRLVGVKNADEAARWRARASS